ncbi:MAG: hypothetical protein ACTHOG_10705 [Marmoricola sp.]
MGELEARQRKRPRHLMDPADLGKPRLSAAEFAAERASLNRVRRWVASVLIVTTIFHLVVGLVIAAFVLPSERTSARIGLLVIAGFFAVVAGAAAVRLARQRGDFAG